MKRRQFIALLGGGAAAWPLAARAQQGERVRRIGVLVSIAPDDPEAQARVAAFIHELQQLGWADGRNLRIDIRWGAGDAERIRRYAAELVAVRSKNWSEVEIPSSGLSIPCSLKKFPVRSKKFPVPLRREFRCKSLNSLADWTLDRRHWRDYQSTGGGEIAYEATREAAMAAFAKSWRRE